MSAPRMDRGEAAGNAARNAAGNAPGSSTAALVISWVIVGIPAAWGVAQTVIKSLALFR